MIKIDENIFLKMRALAAVIDKCLIDTSGSDDNIEYAMVLSEMNVELFKQATENIK
ncbi:MAG: hypothetical protein UH249_02515 [Acutalibacteraceae bacterium]|nr:hypothetical protein [Acutalibacteraceae bacterium]